MTTYSTCSIYHLLTVSPTQMLQRSSSLYPSLRKQSRIYPCACPSSKVSQANSNISKCNFSRLNKQASHFQHRMNQFSRSFHSKCHRLGDLNKRTLFSFGSEIEKSKISMLDLQTVVFSLYCYMAFLLCVHPQCIFLFLQKHQSYWIRAPFS